MSDQIKVFKVTLCVVDLEEWGREEVLRAIEGGGDHSGCTLVSVHGVEEREVDWTDDHPLNYRDKGEAFRALFGEEGPAREWTGDDRMVSECGVGQNLYTETDGSKWCVWCPHEMPPPGGEVAP